jgi:hypothetical protein
MRKIIICDHAAPPRILSSSCNLRVGWIRITGPSKSVIQCITTVTALCSQLAHNCLVTYKFPFPGNPSSVRVRWRGSWKWKNAVSDKADSETAGRAWKLPCVGPIDTLRCFALSGSVAVLHHRYFGSRHRIPSWKVEN